MVTDVEGDSGPEGTLAIAKVPDIKDRLTVVESVYHQPFGESPVEIPSRFSRNLKTREQVYSRRLTATEDWQSLECGWLGNAVGMLVISNDEGKNQQANPTDEERKALAAKVLELCHSDASRTMHSPARRGEWLIPPGESMRGCPVAAQQLLIRCQSGAAKFTLHLIPE